MRENVQYQHSKVIDGLINFKIKNKMNNKKLAYFLLRIIVGVSMFGHGLVRLPKIDAFSSGMAEKFVGSIIPQFVVEPFGYLLTIAEFVIGIFLILGLFTKQNLVAGTIVMIALVFGSSAVENWPVINSQFWHAAIFLFLLWHLDYNSWAIDTRKKTAVA